MVSMLSRYEAEAESAMASRDSQSAWARRPMPKVAVCSANRRAAGLATGNETEQELPVDVKPAIIPWPSIGTRC